MATIQTLQDTLLPRLSQGATITVDSPSRWSTYETPMAIGTVHVNSETDVAVTVSHRALGAASLTYSMCRFNFAMRMTSLS
jgi:hypothetical protein